MDTLIIVVLFVLLIWFGATMTQHTPDEYRIECSSGFVLDFDRFNRIDDGIIRYYSDGKSVSRKMLVGETCSTELKVHE